LAPEKLLTLKSSTDIRSISDWMSSTTAPPPPVPPVPDEVPAKDALAEERAEVDDTAARQEADADETMAGWDNAAARAPEEDAAEAGGTMAGAGTAAGGELDESATGDWDLTIGDISFTTDSLPTFEALVGGASVAPVSANTASVALVSTVNASVTTASVAPESAVSPPAAPTSAAADSAPTPALLEFADVSSKSPPDSKSGSKGECHGQTDHIKK
jgi:hypothetical protein